MQRGYASWYGTAHHGQPFEHRFISDLVSGAAADGLVIRRGA